VLGGASALANRVAIIGVDGSRTELPSKITDRRVRKGELISFETAGGGGYGDPFERELELVELDLRRGHVSPEQLADYGVVLVAGTNRIDAAATAAKRTDNQVEKEGLNR
jgi:N-methylhydantoinase B